MAIRSPSLREFINADDFLYEEYFRTYAYITKDPKDVKVIWLFDRELSLLLLDFILLSEQLLKKALITVIDKNFPNLENDFKIMGINAIYNKYSVFQNVDCAIFEKTMSIANEKQVLRITFQTLVHSLSLRTFNRLLLNVEKSIRDELICEVNLRLKATTFDDENLSRFLYIMLYIRNVASHNGQLFQKRTVQEIENNCFGVPSNFIKMLLDFLGTSEFKSILEEDYKTVLESYKDINEKYEIWK
jgi:hypothetical protein